jgi:pilus assembly protein CpaB
MRPKSLILLALALGCGLVASIGISQVMERNSRGASVSIETSPIYVAKHNINLGDPFDASMLVLQDWPKDRIPPGAISSLEELTDRRPRQSIFQGEPILESKLLAPGQLADPTGGIPDGYRLKTIGVDAESSVAGLLSPGDRVDVSLFVDRNERQGFDTAKTKVILQNIRVFAVEQMIQRSPDGGDSRTIPKTVSLVVTPEQANKITLAEQLGKIDLIPRNPNDEAAVSVTEATVEDLLGDGKSRNSREEEQRRDQAEASDEGPGLLSGIMQMMKQAAQAKPPFRMEIVEADQIREMEFDPTTGKPIREPEQQPGVPAIPAGLTTAIPTPMPTPPSDPTGVDENGLPTDFPIDLGELTND